LFKAFVVLIKKFIGMTKKTFWSKIYIILFSLFAKINNSND